MTWIHAGTSATRTNLITDACILLANKPWDTAAGVIIAAEAGAHVVDLDGSMHTTRSTATIAAVPGLIAEIIGLIDRSQTPTAL